MLEVLGRLNEGLALLEKKLEEVSKKEVLLKNAKADLEVLQNKNIAAANNLQAKERLMAKYDDLETEISNAKLKTEKVGKELIDAENKRLSYDRKIASIASKEKEVEEMRALFVKKNASLDDQLAKTKELQEQLKAKLQSLGIK